MKKILCKMVSRYPSKINFILEKKIYINFYNFAKLDDGIQKCNLELIETVPDVLIEKDYQEQLTKKSIFDIIYSFRKKFYLYFNIFHIVGITAGQKI